MRLKSKIFILTILVISMLSLSISVSASSIGTVKIKSTVLEEKSFTGQVINNRTYVDLLGLLNCLPFLVNPKAMSYNAQTKTLKIYSNDFASNTTPILQFKVGDNFFYYNNEKINLDTKILLVNNRIEIPLKPVVSVYDINVVFDQTSKTINVSK
ncbi:Copper amine oxidase N-terminal domain-containing protein [Paenibacillus sophorae]|uniref:Copper amine oxidase N-terminal domain-containing protein n=1 Tax=Paenibacillus sophorae TaxID=1333845 RepID=A0A1H8VK25_9BACL|nr:stalk domain-containing protein [Paenibacillus sophorae]QWU17208.1 copper amine oxidase N-terminal domain-containing protein [Paenibacillus sophorae]SEP15683.1 Copper amine oxidase N-terminal domain-containing protein [Paenibacillus sophorae]